MAPRPAAMFDREAEWNALDRFARHPAGEPRIGIVYGRRRHGKSFLLRWLVTEHGGIYHHALEEERVPALARFGSSIVAAAGLAGDVEVRYPDWDQAFRAIVTQAHEHIIAIDEFPYLMAQAPELPSVVQRAYDDARAGALPPFALLLSGSAISVMSRLLGGQQALRGRAILDMPLRPFDFRESRRFWGIADPDTAFQVHAIVGGAPGYRALLPGSPPHRPGDIAAWLARGVLDPAHALFRETEYLMTEDPTMTDRALYGSILAAIAQGNTTPGRIAAVVGRPVGALPYPLSILQASHFVLRDEDALLERRARIRISDPLVRFHALVTRPDIARFEQRETAAAWGHAAPRFAAGVLGPHFEAVARDWTMRYASQGTLGGTVRRVGSTQVNDAAARERYELDVVAIGARADDRCEGEHILAIGEAKGGTARRTVADLRRLERLRTLLAGRAPAADARLLVFSRSGFTRELIATAGSRDDVALVDIERLYEGD